MSQNAGPEGDLPLTIERLVLRNGTRTEPFCLRMLKLGAMPIFESPILPNPPFRSSQRQCTMRPNSGSSREGLKFEA